MEFKEIGTVNKDLTCTVKKYVLIDDVLEMVYQEQFNGCRSYSEGMVAFAEHLIKVLKEKKKNE